MRLLRVAMPINVYKVTVAFEDGLMAISEHATEEQVFDYLKKLDLTRIEFSVERLQDLTEYFLSSL